ncbi:hypothetical protein [Oligoflexus tunisiensis]|uniref:hypothetical protein n=1 Tax=Oligoflexus tunisiensis TaxID=708132 RepID=UPI00114CE51B|nr:hypothetical protein [Oligoflexus tunisiensis]
MRKSPCFLLFFIAFPACKTSHEFTLRNTSEVSKEEAPFIDLLVKNKIATLNGEVESTAGTTIKVKEIGPSRSFLVDFDKASFEKIIKSACDKNVSDLKVQSVQEKSAELEWGFKRSSDSGETVASYHAKMEINEKHGYEISCSFKQ